MGFLITLKNSGRAYVGNDLLIPADNLSKSKSPISSTMATIPALPSVFGTCIINSGNELYIEQMFFNYFYKLSIIVILPLPHKLCSLLI